ncbi:MULTISPECIES: amidase [unclassified Mesorhizobium]|uniref:amidase n=1 Tax=unclassified Mesorhizobium TaxID=325217 RepID=UPI000FC9EBDB|nr:MULTISPECIES: amidase [unclassified Mesorhizobium]TGP23588.1 amidase [Mesorhizobium sp. M1D.F.Ca.ET.231.01.1.1]TGP33732.1 amidase [Mesorhizobium sp. M1D.F.Ca.ET.234.01.1.1]TGS47098.1 amidase [Mesorhizobium sp. M1D.F.Ca.ET.184.01.1.1]TGS62356.1 amidase [Mesorhizobium sp. M1D.F.Ca.ET.183.01.1.1]
MRPSTKHAVPPAGDICRLSAIDLAQAIRQRRLSVREVVNAFLDRIEAVNPLVNAIVSLRERAGILAEAERADAHLAEGGATGSLFGLPIAIKDLALTKGLRTSFGSPIFADFVPQEDDFFVERLRKAGAIIIGKTNVPEFGLGSNTYNPVFGPTLNAFDPALTAGGSSGGAAVALALDMLPVADGSDFGGSLRNPAAYNNVYGFRPSQGLVPAGPDIDVFHAQMGVEGPMGRNIADIALLLDEQAGYHPRAPLSHHKQGSFLEGLGTKAAGGRIAWLGDLGGHLPMEQGILDLCEAALARFAEASFHAEALVPDFDFEALWQAFVTLRQASSGCGLKAHYDDPEKRRLLKPEAVWEVEQAMRLSAPQVHAATVRRSSWHRTLLSLFERFDLIVLPTAQVFAFEVATHWPREVAGRAMDSYHRWMQVSAFATLGGCPALNVPVGFDDKSRPMGMQLIGRPRGDLAVLKAGAAYEATLPWPAGAG